MPTNQKGVGALYYSSGYNWISHYWKNHANHIVFGVVPNTPFVRDSFRRSYLLRTIGSVAANFFGPWGAAYYSAYMTRVVYGGSLNDTARAGAFAYASARVTTKIGDYQQAYGWNTAETAYMHGMAQGSLSYLQGGSFGAGFASGFSGKMAGDYGLLGSMAAGGISSVAAGGSFEDGMKSGAVVYLFNEAAHEKAKADTSLGSYLPGTSAGDEAAMYWADRVNNSTFLEDPLARAGLGLSVLWTPDTAVATGLTLGAAGTVAIAERAGLLWMRAYPNAGGEGLGIDWGGKNVIRFDWHRFKVDGVTVSRPHIDSKPLGLKHWPW